MNKHLSKYYILLGLTLLFAAPSIGAYFFYHHPHWLGKTKINKGQLLTPPIALDSLGQRDKWQLIYWSPGPCDKTCWQELNQLTRIRLALGRQFYLVDQWLFFSVDRAKEGKMIKPLLTAKGIHLRILAPKDRLKLENRNSLERIFIANSANYLVLSYHQGTNPNDIYQDLKVLLHTNDSKKG